MRKSTDGGCVGHGGGNGNSDRCCAMPIVTVARNENVRMSSILSVASMSLSLVVFGVNLAVEYLCMPTISWKKIDRR